MNRGIVVLGRSTSIDETFSTGWPPCEIAPTALGLEIGFAQVLANFCPVLRVDDRLLFLVILKANII
eukprot:10561809-Prorocentrum_lima.AAC.1